MEKILLFLLASVIILILLLTVFFFYNCLTLFYNSVMFDENILWSSVVRFLPRRARNPTDRDTVTAPAEIICNQTNISLVEEDQRNQFKRRKSTAI